MNFKIKKILNSKISQINYENNKNEKLFDSHWKRSGCNSSTNIK